MWAKYVGTDTIGADHFVNLESVQNIRISTDGTLWFVVATLGTTPVQLTGTFPTQAECEAALAQMMTLLGTMSLEDFS